MKNTDTPIPLEYIGVIFDSAWHFPFDIYKHSLSAKDGLPPYSQAKIINLLSLKLSKSKCRVCLWISVDSPGIWFLAEIKRLIKYRIPIIVLPADEGKPTEFDLFRSDMYWTYPARNRRLPISSPGRTSDDELQGSLLSALRALARMDSAHTIEIAAMTGLSKTYIRGLLKKLQEKKLIRWERIGKYNGWKITKTGIRAAHRSWNVSKGVHFAPYRKEYRYAGERHRRTARMWRAWLEIGYKAEIWACWTEAPMQRGIPDALAWGRMDGYEFLFWLEVDTGHSSKKVMRSRYSRRLKQIYIHSMEWNLPIIFCIMGPPWVVEYFPNCIPRLYPGVAMIGHDWREFGTLPPFMFQYWNEDIKTTVARRKNSVAGQLPFDPSLYPPKPKAPKPPKPPKPKSKKEPFSRWGESNYWIRDYHEE